MEAPLREITFSQTHRRTHKRRSVVVSQFDDAQPHVLPAGLAWHYTVQTGSDGPWSASYRVKIALDASDDDVIRTVVRDLASLGWDRDPAVASVAQ